MDDFQLKKLSLVSGYTQLRTTISVLIVDDSESDRLTYSRYLQSDSETTYLIIEAETLVEGLKLWRSHQPDVVLIDLNLPDGDGLEFLEAIKVECTGESTPVIMLTGMGNEKKAVQAMKLRVADYLIKGDITKKSLTTTVRQVLRETLLSHQLRRSQQEQILISEIALRMREFLNLEDISNAIVKEVRQFIRADRVAIYQFNPDMSGTIVAEDIVSPWQPCLNAQVEDTCFRENLGGAYCDGKIFVANDIYSANLTACHLQLLERFQVRANLVVPILLPNLERQTLWGLLIFHQCSAPREWLEADIQLIQQLAVQLAISIKQTIAYQQVQTELTERKRAEQELQKLNQSLEARVLERTQQLWQVNKLQRAILDGTDYAIISTDLNGIIQTFNDGAEKMLGYSMGEVVGNVTPEIFFDPQEVSDKIAKASKILGKDIGVGFKALAYMATQGLIEEEWINIRKDGSRFPVSISVTALKDDNGKMIGTLSFRKDISDRKQAELQLQQTTDRLALALKSGAIGCWELDIKQNIIVWDDRMYELYGCLEETYSHIPYEMWRNALHPDDLSATETLSQEAILGRAEFDCEFRVIHPDRSIHFIKAYGKVKRDSQGNAESMIGINLDISDRKLAEEALRASDQRWKFALESVGDGAWDWNVENNEVFYSPQWKSLLGYADDEIENRFEVWENLVHPDDLAQCYENINKCLNSEVLLYDSEHRLLCKDGSYKWILSRGKVFEWDANGHASRMMGTHTDLSDRKQAEAQLQKINNELLRATKLKDEFLANMSHELRTPLNSILGISELLKDQILGSLNQKQLKAISTIGSSGEHLLSLINDILDLSKISAGMIELDIASVSVKDLCHSSLVFVKQQAYNKSIQIHNYIPTHINSINIDERRIKQVLINLLTNAVKFTPKGGKINLFVAIGSGNTWKGEATIPQQLRDINSPTILFQVVDTGIGISADDLQLLFQPFVQVDSALNRQYEGTGLGLALVKQIVELHGGQVMAESEIGQGSRFTFVLPYDVPQSSDPESIPTATTLLSQDLNSENAIAPLILLAEDNEANIQTFFSYLTAINYRVIVARNGEEAIVMAKANSPDAILMDIQMPRMDGLEATKQIRLDPNLIDIPIIAITALAMEGDRERCLEAGANDYMSKPVKLRELNLLIQKVLGSIEP